MKSLQRILALAALVLGTNRLSAQTDDASTNADTEIYTAPNLVAKTAGGKQFWADRWFFHDWRIQRNALTGHCRLLAGDNRRHAWGSFESCRQRLDEIRRRDRLPPMQGKAVIVLHGLFRTRSAMRSLCDALTEEGFSTFAVGYPTTRGSVADHAESLDSVVRSLEGIEDINFVGHSLGNLVVRHWLQDMIDHQRTLPPGQRFGRMVMLAPPNRHPEIAVKLLNNQLASFVAGPTGQQLARGWQILEPRLATPTFEFGILAGGKGDNRGYNPLLPGDDDAVVTVDGTRLAGARDFRRLPVLHSFFMNDADAQKLTLQFLTHGHFESEDSRQPIAVTEEPKAISTVILP